MIGIEQGGSRLNPAKIKLDVRAEGNSVELGAPVRDYLLTKRERNDDEDFGHEALPYYVRHGACDGGTPPLQHDNSILKASGL